MALWSLCYHALALDLRCTVNAQLILFTENLLSYFHSMFEVGVENLIKSLLLGLTSYSNQFWIDRFVATNASYFLLKHAEVNASYCIIFRNQSHSYP